MLRPAMKLWYSNKGTLGSKGARDETDYPARPSSGLMPTANYTGFWRIENAEERKRLRQIVKNPRTENMD